MKKKLLFIALPALMVLSGCSGVSFKQEANVMLEDTLAHEEIFGEAEEAVQTKIMNPRRALEDLEKPHIGFQFMPYHDDEANEDFYAVRFVAAVASNSVTATWTRGFSKANSDQTKHPLSAAGIVATKSYTSLNNNGEPASVPEDFGAKYNYLLVYSMYKIPTDLANGYIAAYLTLDDGVNTPVKSDVVAARVAGGNAFSFSATKSAGYFMQGRINGETQIVDMDESPSGTDVAKKTQAFKANDEFGYFYYNPGTTFQYFGYDTFNRETYYFEQSASSDYFKVRVNSTIILSPNVDKLLYATCTAASVTLYLKPNSNWLATTKFAVWYTDNSTWATGDGFMTEVDAVNHIYKLDNYNFIAHPTIIFTRHNTTAGSPSWADGNKWDQTNDLTYVGGPNGNSNPAESLYTIADGAWSYGAGSWSIRSA